MLGEAGSSAAPWESASTSAAAQSSAVAGPSSAAMPPPTASPAPAAAAAHAASGSGSGSGALLSMDEVARDSSIFTPEGWIVFPRSDGAADYQPPNVVVPPKSASDVNYFHVYKPDEVDKYDWRTKVGQKLAEHFGKPKLSASGKTWRLRWPKDYFMTEQRKGPPTSPRTDPYLFGSHAHRFRSAPEFFPHAVWLLRDPSMKQSNCECKYCSGKKTMGPDSVKMGRGAPAKAKTAAPVPKKDTRKGATGRRQKPLQLQNKLGVQIMARPVKRNHMPGLPNPIASVPHRTQELPHGAPKEGQCEGYRVGEICLVRLDPPVLSPDGDAECAMDSFPVRIESKKFVAEVDDVNGSGLEGNVTQRVVYDVRLLGTEENARIGEERLLPFLAGRIPPGLQRTVYGNPADFPWLETGQDVPKLYLFPDPTERSGLAMPRADYKTVVSVFAYAVQSISMLRSIYTLTDRFSREELKEAAPPTVSAAASQPPASASPPAGATSASPQLGAAKPGEIDRNAYWQGILFGCERIWVGDTVRLNLAPTDIEAMMEALTPQCRMLGVEADSSAPYLMRLKAIFLPRGRKEKSSGDGAKDAAAPSATGSAMAGPSTQNGADGPSASVSQASRPAEASSNAPGDVSVVTDEEEADERDELNELDDLEEEEKKCTDAARVEQIEAEKLRLVEKIGARIRLAGDVYQVLEQKEYVRRQATGGMAPNTSLGSTQRPTYVAPSRSFVAEANDGLLPPSNVVPRGFVLQRVNQASVEIECTVTQLAGRLWSSFAPAGLALDAVLEQRQRAYTPSESVEDARIQLSLAGLIPGCVKNVGALTMHLHREATIATCQETARSLLRNFIRLQYNEEHGIIDDDASAAGGSTSPAKGRKKRKSLAAATDGSASPASAAMRPISDHAAAHATPTASKKARKSAAGSAASPAMGTPSGRGASSASARGLSPPLPQGWVKKTSRSDPTKVYYVNVGLRKTSWDRPLE